jgi:diacylglycerol kinase
VGIFSETFLIAGVVGSFLSCVFLDKTHAYRPMMRTGYCLAPFVVLLLMSNIAPGRFAWLVVSFGLFGFFCLPMLPTTIETVVETTFPVQESYSGGTLLMVANYIGVLATDQEVVVESR